MNINSVFSSSWRSLRTVINQISANRLPTVMSTTKKVSPHWLSAASLSAREGDGPVTKLQFPPLPQKWEGKYVPGQMYKYQASLPKLPVPPLQQTLHKYITSLEPLLSREELEHTKALVTEFGKPGGTGEKLQKLLENRAEEKDNWLFDWWAEVAYLGYRLPVVVHSSPGIGYPLMPAKDLSQFVRLAATMVLFSMKWILLLQHEAILPDYWRKPMCMSQLDVFSKCRIPQLGVDRLRHTPFSNSKHIIIVRNGHFFKLDVLCECPDGSLAVVPSSHIIQQLHKIIEMSSNPSQLPIGVLTTLDRDTWARSRERLISEPINEHSLDVIERSQFVLCLDRAHPQTSQLQSSSVHSLQDGHKTILANRVLHGNGSQQNSGNRWFDHAVQIFVGEDGLTGSLLEHSAADGSSINMHLFILDTLKTGYDILGESSPVSSSALCPAEKLHWKLSPESAEDVQVAKRNMESLVEDIDLQMMTFEDFGKDIPKQFKLSPDGFIQNAIQLTYYKLYNQPTATYESATTREYYKGRTDTIRSSTNAALNFVKTMVNPKASVGEKLSSMGAAIQAHSDYVQDGISGQAIDRHLLGLKLIAHEAGMETPELFKDEAYLRSNHFCLSTSQLPTFNHDVILCFGPVVPDGYGVCYCIQERRIMLMVSSFRSHPKTDSMLFGSKLMQSMREMQAVLVAANGLNANL